jgi:hypothetical protein
VSTEIVLNFPKLILELIAKARAIKAMLTNNPAFPVPWPPFVRSLDDLDAAIIRLEQSYYDALNHDVQKVALRKTAHEELKIILRNIATYVQLVANGDETLLKTSGFDLRHPQPKSKSPGPLTAPIVTVKRGKESGTFLVKASIVAYALSYEVQITEGDPTVEENWKEFDTVGRASRIWIHGLTRGREYSIRVRAIGANGRGPWSLICTEIAL